MRRGTMMVLVLFIALVGLFVGGAHAVDGRAGCFEDEVLMWSAQTNDHTACVPIDHVVDRGIEIGVQQGTLKIVSHG